jgi:hypothetical protein
MKHFNIWQWSDFVRGLVEETSRTAMEAHLASGCRRCERFVQGLRDVAATARGEADYAPPDHAIRHARAVFSMHHPEKVSFPRLVAQLVHDSLRSPLPAGMRSQDRLWRHALYEAGTYSLDLQVEHEPRSGLVTLIGQLADRNQPESTAADVPVWLMERKSLVASTLCNRFGEFQLRYAPARNLRLQVPLPAVRRRLEVALDGLSLGPPGRRPPASRPRQTSSRTPAG